MVYEPFTCAGKQGESQSQTLSEHHLQTQVPGQQSLAPGHWGLRMLQPLPSIWQTGTEVEQEEFLASPGSRTDTPHASDTVLSYPEAQPGILSCVVPEGVLSDGGEVVPAALPTHLLPASRFWGGSCWVGKSHLCFSFISVPADSARWQGASGLPPDSWQ